MTARRPLVRRALDHAIGNGPPTPAQEAAYIVGWAATTAVSAILLALARRWSRVVG